MSLVDILLGKPLATSDERAEQIGPLVSYSHYTRRVGT